jgi:CRISPR-associated endonuclease/helicase Cas3
MWRYWGKADPAFDGRHHAAVLHCLDVAACAAALVEQDAVLRRKLAAALGSEADVTATTAFFCALHDIGKFDVRFQVKAPAIAEKLQPRLTSRVARVPYDHGGEGFRMLDADVELEELLGRGGSALLQGVCGHHGDLPERRGPERGHPQSLIDQDIAVRAAVVDAFIALFTDRGARTCIGKLGADAQQLVAGVCAVADWVGSNTEWFAYEEGPVDLAVWLTAARERAVLAIEAAGLVPRALHASSFAALFPGFSPRGVQRVTEGVVVDAPALIVVEAEMGQGKTEAALSLAARFLDAGLASGIYVGLPTMATSNAMFARVDAFVPRLLQVSDDAPAHVALAHGQARKNPLFQQRFRERPLSGAPYDDEAGVVCARWLLGSKRALLAQVGVGTVDQALQAVLRVHHQFVRLTALARDVVIVDEVHAYDAYMETLLEHAVRWWGALHVPVILLSATLPAERRARLINAWSNAPVATVDDGVTAAAAPYPAVTVVRRDRDPTCAALPDDEPRTVRRVALDLRDDPIDADVAACVDELVAAAVAGARVAWIRNTVGDAQEAWRLLRKRAASAGVTATMFHARYRHVDRRRIEGDVLASFGKSAPSGGRIVLATQVVEQSLDLDFDWLVSDLAPIDLLLQRMGRLHRHVRSRPAAWILPTFTVRIGSDDNADAVDFGVSNRVYDGPTLWLARQALRSRADGGLVLPNDIRPLVEASYHPTLRQQALVTPRLRELEEKRAQETAARAAKAQQVVITSATSNAIGTTVDDDDDTVQALTRDGASTTLLPLLWRDDEARTLDGAAFNLDASAPSAWKTLDLLGDQTLSYSTPAPVRSVAPAGDASAWDAFCKRFVTFAARSALGRVTLLPLREVAFADDGAVFRGALRLGQRRRSVLYSRTLGLHLVKETHEQS